MADRDGCRNSFDVRSPSKESSVEPIGDADAVSAGSISRAETVLSQLSPGGLPYKLVVPLANDESRWFLHAVDEKIVRFQDCDPTCPRLRRRKVSGPDEFAMQPGEFRHLFSARLSDGQRLNREYVPHIAAYARAILEFGYSQERASFSRYRAFAKSHISKRAGTGYETDGEFYDPDGRIQLHLEVKTKPAEVEAIASELDRAGTLTELPADTRKEVEYILALSPGFFWLVGPGSVDPARHVFAVRTDGITAKFDRVPDVPRSPVPYAAPPPTAATS